MSGDKWKELNGVKWRVDRYGNPVCYHFSRGSDANYDHIVLWSKSHDSSLENCQVLQSMVNTWNDALLQL
ncbi:LOW QUALITY PROTEIN: hypothetical protein YC2023_061108 [Brassica napus]